MTKTKCPYCHRSLPLTNDAFCTFCQNPLGYWVDPPEDGDDQCVASRQASAKKLFENRIANWWQSFPQFGKFLLAFFLVPVGIAAFAALTYPLHLMAPPSVSIALSLASVAVGLYLFWQTTSGLNFGWRVVIYLAYIPILLSMLFPLSLIVVGIFEGNAGDPP